MPTFGALQPLEIAPINSSECRGGEVDVNAHVDRTGCGPWQAMYVFFCCFGWAGCAVVQYSDKFMTTPLVGKTNTSAWGTNVSYSDFVDALDMTSACRRDIFDKFVEDNSDKVKGISEFKDDEAATEKAFVEWNTTYVVESEGEGIARGVLYGKFTKYLFAGWLFGGLLAAPTDIVSTKHVMCLCTALFLVAWIACLAAAPLGISGQAAVTLFCWSRFISWIGLGCVCICQFCWMEEMVGAPSKIVLTIVPLTCWVLGGLASGVLNQWVVDWRVYYVIAAFVCATPLLAVSDIVETPQGLYTRKPLSHVLKKFFGMDTGTPIEHRQTRLLEGLNQIRDANGLRLLDSLDDVPTAADSQTQLTELVSASRSSGHSNAIDGPFIFNLAIMAVAWCAWSTACCGIQLQRISGLDVYTDSFWGMLIGWPSNPLAAVAMSAISNRRLLMFAVYLPSGLAFLCAGWSFHMKENQFAVFFSFASQLFTCAAISIVYVLTPAMFEKWPRLAMGVCVASARLGGVLAASYPKLEAPAIGLFYGEGVYKDASKEDQKRMMQATKASLFALPMFATCFCVWLLPATAFSKATGRILATPSFAGARSPFTSWVKGNWSYFVRRPLFALATALQALFLLATTVWALYWQADRLLNEWSRSGQAEDILVS